MIDYAYDGYMIVFTSCIYILYEIYISWSRLRGAWATRCHHLATVRASWLK